MKSASEVLKSKNEKIQQRIKDNSELINIELLEFEKTLNKYEESTEDTKPYITVPLIIKTTEVKNTLKQNGYIIDNISNDIRVNTTRVYLNETDYNIATRRDIKRVTNINQNQETFAKEYESKWIGNKAQDTSLADLVASLMEYKFLKENKIRYKAGY